MKIRIIALVSMLIVPSFLYAGEPLGSLVDLANTLATGVVTSLGYLMFTVAVVAFLWGMVQFIWDARSGDADKGMENGKQFMLWGLIALFVMFSVWGIIKFTQGVFNIQGQTTITIPNIQLLGSTSAAPATVNGGGNVSDKVQAGVGCIDTSQCASGLTCVGTNASNKVCTGSGGGAVSTQTICSVTINTVVYTGKYNTATPPQCIPDVGGNVNSPQTLAFGTACDPDAKAINIVNPSRNLSICGQGLECPSSYLDNFCRIANGFTCQTDKDCAGFSDYSSKCLAGRSGAKICTPVN